MSDQEEIDNGNRRRRNGVESEDSDEEATERKIVTYRSRSKSGSRSPHSKLVKLSRFSRSRSRSHHRSRRSRSRHRSRSRSGRRHSRSYRYSRSGSRSRSESGSPYRSSRRGGYYHRSHSRSPMSNRRRHNGTRENPKPSKCIGVFGLSVHTSENQLHHIFSKYGSVTKVQVVIDAKSGRSRGFAFVYFETFEQAKAAKEQCSGMEIDNRKIRVDFSITQRAHTPTPGIYMGKPTYTVMKWRDDNYYPGHVGSTFYCRMSRSHRSPSPYSSRRRSRYDRSRSRYDRSRSRSDTPPGKYSRYDHPYY